jgi:hypothetical protein
MPCLEAESLLETYLKALDEDTRVVRTANVAIADADELARVETRLAKVAARAELHRARRAYWEHLERHGGIRQGK